MGGCWKFRNKKTYVITRNVSKSKVQLDKEPPRLTFTHIAVDDTTHAFENGITKQQSSVHSMQEDGTPPHPSSDLQTPQNIAEQDKATPKSTTKVSSEIVVNPEGHQKRRKSSLKVKTTTIEVPANHTEEKRRVSFSVPEAVAEEEKAVEDDNIHEIIDEIGVKKIDDTEKNNKQPLIGSPLLTEDGVQNIYEIREESTSISGKDEGESKTGEGKRDETSRKTTETSLISQSSVSSEPQLLNSRGSTSSYEVVDDGTGTIEVQSKSVRRRSGIVPVPLQEKNIHEKLPQYPKEPEDEVIIKTAIEKNDFLSRIIKKKVLDDIIAAMYKREVSASERIIKQGERGTHMFVSAKGKYQIIIKGKVVSEFSDVRVFGELAILYNAKRLATIKAISTGKIWVLDQHVYQKIMYRYNIKEQDEMMELLLKNEKLNVTGREVLQVVANLLKKEFFQAETAIVRQGEKGDKFYIIRAGTVTITKEGEGVVGIYRKGDCFGELALLKEDCRQATVKADPPGVECLTLARKEFINHFGELESWKDAKVYDTKKDSIRSVVVMTEYRDLDINDLKIKKTIGVGGFGRVELVQHRKQKDLVFALKYLKKIDIVLQSQQEHVYNEKKIQMACKSPFIVNLYKTFKDDKYIYFLMEACLGGDLWSLLQRQKNRRFEEKDARFICACVLESFEYLHTRGIIYRDLKPENLLIDVNGYIKLTDFGFAKKVVPRNKTFTFAGTPEYVAPEIVLNRGHDRAVDYWAYGAFVFEMLTGKTPFRTDDSTHMRTYNKILSGIDYVPFPSYVAPKARHLIEKLCRPIPAERLGMQRGGIKDVKSHRWFLGFDWQKLQNQEIPSPFKPKLTGPTDTRNFDEFKRDGDVPPDEKSGWDKTF